MLHQTSVNAKQPLPASAFIGEARIDDPLRRILDRLMRAAEQDCGGDTLASVLLLSEDGRRLAHGAAPSLPAAYTEAIDGIEIGPNVGSCGAAAYARHPIYVTDIATDPRWEAFRDLALGHGLRACWSTPIESLSGRLLGAFAIYHKAPRRPTRGELEAIGRVSAAVAHAIERCNSAAAA